MGILVTAGDGFDIHLVAADFLGQRGEIGSGGHNLQFVLSATRRRNGECEDEQEGGHKCADTADSSVSCCVLHRESPEKSIRTGARRGRPSRREIETRIRWRSNNWL